MKQRTHRNNKCSHHNQKNNYDHEDDIPDRNQIINEYGWYFDTNLRIELLPNQLIEHPQSLTNLLQTINTHDTPITNEEPDPTQRFHHIKTKKHLHHIFGKAGQAIT